MSWPISARRDRHASVPPPRQLHRRIAAGLSTLALVAGSVVGVTAAATADPAPQMTISTSSTGPTVTTGGTFAYTVRVECSDIVDSVCANPTVTMTAPHTADGQVLGFNPASDSRYVKAATLSADGTTAVFELTDLSPGQSIEFQAIWTVPNFTTLPGLELLTEPSLTFSDGGDEPKTITGQNPAAVTTVTAPSITVTKTMVTPKHESKVMPGEPVTYELRACVPGNKLGTLNLKSLTVVDTYAGDAKNIGAAVVVDDADGGVVDAAAHTITWDLPATAVTSCDSSEPDAYFVRTVTLTYPDSMIPAAEVNGAIGRNPFTNVVKADGVALDDTTVTGTATRNHAFFSDVSTGGPGDWTVAISKDIQGLPSNGELAQDSTTQEHHWRIITRWTTSNPAMLTDARNLMVADRVPCVANGVSASLTSPLGSPGTDLPQTNYPDLVNGTTFANNGSLDGVTFADECTTPAERIQRFSWWSSAKGYSNLRAVSVRYYDTATSTFGTAQVLTPTGLVGAPSDTVFVYAGDPAQQVGSPNLNLPATAIITEFRVLYGQMLPEDSRVAENQRDPFRADMQVHATSTQAFVDSGLFASTNQAEVAGSAALGADGQTSDPAAKARQRASYAVQFGATMVDLGISKNASSPNANKLVIGDTLQWTVRVTNGQYSSEPVKPTVVDILPVGLSYVEGSAAWTLPDGVDGPGDPVLGTRTIDGVEYETLTWTFPTEWPAKTTATLTFDTQVGLGASEGSHNAGLNGQYVAVFNQIKAITKGTNSADVYDLNGDGSTTDRVATANGSWNVTSQSGARIEKWVKGSQDDQTQWIKNGVSAATVDNSGTRVDYRLSVVNTDATSLQDVVIYDVLPHVGDTAIGADLVGVARESKFPVTFRAQGDLPAGVTVEYSTSETPCRPELFPAEKGVEQGACADDWSATLPADPSTVKALRYVIASMKPGEAIDILYTGDVPAFVFKATRAATQDANPVCTASDGTLAGSELAWNNLAFQADRVKSNGDVQKLLPAEAPKVSIREVCGEIGDYAWLDANGNGLQDEGEEPVPGVVFALVDASGNVVLDDEGNPVTSTTDAEGKYSFLVPVGQWSVKVIEVPTDRDYVLTTPNAGSDNAIDSDVLALDTPTEQVTISVTNLKDTTLDAGFVLGAVSVGDLVWVDSDRDGLQDAGEPGIPGVVVTLQRQDADGNRYPVTDRAGNPVTSTTTGPDGTYLFENLPSLPAGQKYVVSVDNAQDALTNYAPTTPGAGDDRGKDSSTGEAASGDLTRDRDSDLTLDFGFVKLVSIGDYVWFDQNGDGQQGTGEPVLPGVEVVLLDADGGEVGRTTTDAEGYYAFTGLLPGTAYTVVFPTTVKVDGKTYVLTQPGRGESNVDSNADPATGNAPVTTPGTGENSAEPGNADDPTIDAGYVQVLVSIGDLLWIDADGDGLQDDGEPGVAGQTVQLKDASGAVVATATTDAQGYYAFTGLDPETAYTVVFPKTVVVDGKTYALTQPGQGDDRGQDSNPAPVTGEAAVTTPAGGSNQGGPGEADDPTIDAGYVPVKVSIGDRLWIDANADGIQDAGEKPVPGVTVILRDADGAKIGEAVTDAEGYYAFKDLDPGVTYVVEFPTTVEVGGIEYVLTDPIRGTDRGVDSNPDPADGTASVTAPATGANSTAPGEADDPTIDAGYKPKLVSIGDRLWIDLDGNGVQDAGEPGVPGAQVSLKDKDGNVVATVTTDAEGYYAFTNLQPGAEYTVVFPKVVTVDGASYELVAPHQGGADVDSDPDLATGEAKVTAPLKGANSAEPTMADDPTIDAGYTLTPVPVVLVSIGDRLWLDLNGNGIQDDGEPGVAGATVTLQDADGNVLKSLTTDAQGNYVFTDLDPDTTYTVVFPATVTVDGKTYRLTQPGAGTPATDSNPDPATGRAPVTTPGSGNNSSVPAEADDPTIDAGYVLVEGPKVSIGDFVWIDANKNGIQDEGEKGVPGVTVTLLDKDGNVIATTTTDENGYYRFDGLEPSTQYYLKFPTTVTVDGTTYPLTKPGQGKDSGKDSDPDANGLVPVISPAEGEDLTFDAGYVPAEGPTTPPTEEPSTPGTPTTPGTPGLPNTGFDGGPAIGLAALLLAAGALLLVVRRRRA